MISSTSRVLVRETYRCEMTWMPIVAANMTMSAMRTPPELAMSADRLMIARIMAFPMPASIAITATLYGEVRLSRNTSLMKVIQSKSRPCPGHNPHRSSAQTRFASNAAILAITSVLAAGR